MSAALRFDTEFSLKKSVSVLAEVITNLEGCSDVSRMLDSGDWGGLVDLEIDYTAPGLTPHAVRMRRQALAFFSKNASLPLGLDTGAVALEKFRKSEEKCRATNSRFRNRSKPFSQGGLDAGLIFQVQRKIADILGPFPGLDKLSFGFGPGSNVGLSQMTSVRRKLSVRPSCTAAALKYIDFLQGNFLWWDTLEVVECVDYGKFATVPKTALTDRAIMVEPLVNSFLQKGVGSYIRNRLLLWGVDLSDQSINQRRALIGSLTGRYATIDLSSASDTIARLVVEELLPYDWWVLLSDLRSPYVKFPSGEISYLQKFSSMGNGFTFELESLIFFAICSVVAGKDVSVYGDDLIVRTEFAESTIKALEHFGFEVNTKKSFSSGPFRESCGKDYFGGSDVRPCYVRGLLSPKELTRLHNFFVRNGDLDLARLFLKHIPNRFRNWGPDGYGDGHLIGDHKKHLPSRLRRKGYSGYVFRTYTTKPTVKRDLQRGDAAAFLYLSTETSIRESDPIVPDPRFQLAAERRRYWNAFLANDPKRLDPSLDSAAASLMMYYERGSTEYKLSRVYCLG